MNFLLLHTAGWDPSPWRDAFAGEGVSSRVVATPAEVRSEERPTVLVIDPTARGAWPAPAMLSLADAGIALIALGAPGETDLPEGLPAEALASFIRHPAGHRQLLMALRAGWRAVAARREVARIRAESAQRGNEVTELTDIGVKLSTERNYNTLLELILTQARRITQSDAGSLYVVETDERGGRHLRFKLAQNQSRPDIPLVEFTIPIDHSSLAGYAAAEGEPLVIDDVYMLPPDVEYSFNRSIDQRYGYRTRSVLSIPMTSHKGEILGVLQLINRKRNAEAILSSPAEAEREAMAYSPHTVKLVKSLAGQAGVAIENSTLYESIERLFEGFVTAAVTAIEQRDPTTSGHSFRVADLTVELAHVIDRIDTGQYRDNHFSSDQVREIRYASLLHDFGKVGVREQVLVKEKKLYPMQLETIRARFEFVMKSAENDANRRRVDYLVENGQDGFEEFNRQVAAELADTVGRLQKDFQFVAKSNEPTVLPEGEFQYLQQLAQSGFDDLEGDRRLLISPEEARILSIRKGNLDPVERTEIESHVTHTFNFLRKIPWTKDLAAVADIAYAHHEKLNGRGYPRKLTAVEIPIQSRMMTISDIYDALTASDRPYKRAISTDRAIDILKMEVNDGLLDSPLVDVFVESKVYERAGILRG